MTTGRRRARAASTRGIAARRGVDDEAVDRGLANGARDLVAEPGVREQQQSEGRPPQPPPDAPEEGRRRRVGELVAEPLREDHAEHPGAPRPEAAGRRIRPGVPEGPGRGHHPLAHRLRDELGAAERLGRASDRDACTLRDVAQADATDLVPKQTRRAFEEDVPARSSGGPGRRRRRPVRAGSAAVLRRLAELLEPAREETTAC